MDLFSKSEIRKFLNKAFELLDDTIGINVVSTVKNVTQEGLIGTIFGGLGKK